MGAVALGSVSSAMTLLAGWFIFCISPAHTLENYPPKRNEFIFLLALMGYVCYFPRKIKAANAMLQRITDVLQAGKQSYGKKIPNH
jgi:hypothetical protein